MKIKQQTPILIVDAIEPVLSFWTELCGYEKVAEVAHEGKLGFVMLQHDGNTLMLQTEASVRADLGAKTPNGLKAGSVCLYIDVDHVKDAVALVEKAKAAVVAGPRTAPYGAKEIFAVAPGGFVVGFAEHDR
jgi:hypothetical protein